MMLGSGEIVGRLVQDEIICSEEISGGRNSRVFRVQCERGGPYLAKFYPPSQENAAGGGRDRLEAEFSALQFMWKNGIRCVPRPIAADKAERCAVYEWVEGSRISSGDATPDDVDEAVRFLLRLRELKSRQDSDSLPAASEACFSVRAVFLSLECRLNSLGAPGNGLAGPEMKGLHDFLRNEFMPVLTDITRRCLAKLDRSGIEVDSELSREDRTLSPSDFGFHNALRTGDHWVFIDFEHFGWDDPAKMISDFVLHPAMELGPDLQRRFRAGLFEGFGDPPRLRKRFEIVYPLFGLKWCLILLNEFLPQGLSRRKFAGDDSADSREFRARQLDRARRMLGKIKNELA